MFVQVVKFSFQLTDLQAALQIARFSTMSTLPKSSKSNVYNSSTCYYTKDDQVKSKEKITQFQVT